MKVIYIASAYSKGDAAGNVRAQINAFSCLAELGYCPIAPLLGHFIQISCPLKYEQWLNIDMELVRRCDAVLRLPGKSKGADKEVSLAISLNKPIFNKIYDVYDYFEGMK